MPIEDEPEEAATSSKPVAKVAKQPAITLHFLNAVLQFPVPIRQVQILNPPLEKGFGNDKWPLLDIIAADELGRLDDIKVQTTRPLGLRELLAYYTASLLVGQLESDEDYHSRRPAIGVCLVDAIEFRSEPALQHSFQPRTDAGLVLTDWRRITCSICRSPPVDKRLAAVSRRLRGWTSSLRLAG